MEMGPLEEAARVLGVSVECRDEKVLKLAFKKRSLEHHPDKNPGTVRRL